MDEEKLNQILEEIQNEKNQKNNNGKWHVGKEIPIALLFAIFIQTAGGIWWAATLTAKIDSLNNQIISLQDEKYTKLDASKDFTTINVKIADLDRRISILENQQNFKK